MHVDAEISWDQQASGTLDITDALLAAFEAAGSPKGVVSSFTGQGLEADWPAEGDDLKGGWRVGAVALERADGVWRTPRHKDARVGTSGARVMTAGSAAEAFVSPPVTARFFAWEFKPAFPLAYDVSRQRIERVSFTLAGDVQRVFTEPGEDEEIILALGSRKVSEAIEGVVPIGDLRRASYIKTDRGRQSLDYLVALARARLLARARAAEVRVTIPFADGVGLSCRQSATVTDSRLPGGTATGKVIAYRLSAGGDGSRLCEVTIGCTIGNGTSQDADPGVPTYVDDGYADPRWQLRAGETIAAVPREVTYPDLTEMPITDDGIDFFRLAPADVIVALDVLNGETAQAAALDARFEDIPAAVEALNAVHTEVVLDLDAADRRPVRDRFRHRRLAARRAEDADAVIVLVESHRDDRAARPATPPPPDAGTRWGKASHFDFDRSEETAEMEARGGIVLEWPAEHIETVAVADLTPVWRKYEVVRITVQQRPRADRVRHRHARDADPGRHVDPALCRRRHRLRRGPRPVRLPRTG